MAKKKQTLPSIEDTPILKAININSIGSNNDPCFGKEYNLTTKECKICGDSELCCIAFANAMGKTRKELEKENKYKDLEILVDKQAFKKTIRALKRAGNDKKTILDKLQAKYNLGHKETRTLYRELTKKEK